jgi:hypothetical protein
MGKLVEVLAIIILLTLGGVVAMWFGMWMIGGH